MLTYRGLIALLSFLAFAQLHAQHDHVAGEALIMLEAGADAKTIAADLSTTTLHGSGLHAAREVSAPMRAWLLRFDSNAVDLSKVLRALKAHPGVLRAQKNHRVAQRSTPNDPDYARQWYHDKIGSEAAWDITTGGLTALGDTIVICIIEGANMSLPDLRDNRWTNPHEIPDNGIDDDGNGYIDDVHGWNHGNGTDNVTTSENHGTRVASIIGATGNNNYQLSGINWNVRMMVCEHVAYVESEVIAAYTYPLVMRRLYNNSQGQQGALVVAMNSSWGRDNAWPSDAPIWCAMYDTLGAEGILNFGATANANLNVDVSGDLPSTCPSEYLITVTNTNENDVLSSAGYGATSIDVAAPGRNILSLLSNGQVGSSSGTSFSTPLTAGLGALLFSAPCTELAEAIRNDPPAAARRVRDALFAGVEPSPSLAGRTTTGGRIHAGNSMQALLNDCSDCQPPYALAAADRSNSTTLLRWRSLESGPWTIRYRANNASTWQVVEGVTNDSLLLSGLEPCTDHSFTVTSACTNAGSPLTSYTWAFRSSGCCMPPEASITASDNSLSIALIEPENATGSVVRIRQALSSWWREIEFTGNGPFPIADLLPCTNYDLQVRSNCGDSTGFWSATYPVRTTGCSDCIGSTPCTQHPSSNNEYIQLVRIDGHDLASDNDGGYSDRTDSMGVDLLIGSSVPVRLVPGFEHFTSTPKFKLFLDLDHNGRFPASELQVQSLPSADPVDLLWNIPAALQPGHYRLRVSMASSTLNFDGCTAINFGEVEDYCVHLHAAVGIGETSAPLVRSYPVPADTWLTLEFAAALHGGTLTVTDMQGRSVSSRSITSNTVQLPTAELPAGVYLYQAVHADGTRWAGRFAVAH